jgi:iron complex outermembrane recepter protein
MPKEKLEQPGRLLILAAAVTAALGMLPTPSAVAQQSGTQAESQARQSFDIPAGSLTAALNALARQAGLALTFDPSLTQGKVTGGLRGEFAPQQALRQLLAGTGLTYRFSDGSTVTLVAESGELAPVQLAPINITGWRQTATRGYLAEGISSATKTEELLVDVPASVSVVTEDLIRDQATTTVTGALRNVPGVGTGPNPGNVSVQESVTIRGFESLLVRVNGVQRRSSGPLSLANVQSVEVLKGPFSVLYGDVSPGGFVNIQTKRPQREVAAEVSMGVNQVAASSLSGTQGLGTVDFTGPFNEDNTVLYRFIASLEGGNSFIDTVENERQFVAPSLSFLTDDDRMRVDLDLRYLRNDETFLYGIPARNGKPDNRIDRNIFLGAMDNDKLTEDYDVELRADFKLTERTRIDGAVTYHRNEIEARALRPRSQVVAPDDTIARRFSLTNNRTTDRQVEANLTHEFSAGDTHWRLLAGGDYLENKLEDTGPGSGNFNGFDTTNVLDPDNDVSFPADDDPRIVKFDRVANDTDQWGFYGQAEIWWRDRLKLLAGARYTQFDYRFASTGFEFEESPSSIDPRFAALFKLTPQTSLYGTYSSSFQQSFSFDPENSKPLEAEQYELGLKHEFAGGRALVTASLFDLTQRNLLTSDPDRGESRQIGEAATQGFELELRGAPTERLQLQAGYTYLDNKISKDNDGNEGNRLPNVAEHAASLWVNYALPLQSEGVWTLGGGVFYVGDRFTGVGNTVKMGDYVTADVVLGYQLPIGERSVSAQIGVRNVFDETYFVGGFGEGVAYRGEPRTAFARLTARF